MKRILGIVLAVLFALSCILLVACNTAVTDLKFTDAPTQVKRGEQIDYSTIHVEATFEDGSTKVLALTDKGVTYDKISTSVAGVTQTLTARYGGKSAEATIEVVEGSVDISNVVVTEYNNTRGYNEYLNAIAIASTEQTGFYTKGTYTVGNVNGYRCVPVVTAVDENLEEITLTDVKTSFKLSLKESNGSYTLLTGDSLELYLANVENNVYYFTKAAEHETFKLEVTLSDEYTLLNDDMRTAMEQVFEVVDGYNAYDVRGLSVIDNCNIKSWANRKNYSFAWDNGKKVSDFTDVKQVILHNNITITAKDLPDNYFWHESDGGTVSFDDAKSRSPEDLRPYLAGSLKEVYLGEDWEKGADSQQRGLFVSSGIGLNGNFLKIDYVDNINTNGENGIYVVHDFNQKSSSSIRKYPESHYSVIAYRVEGQLDGLYTAPVIENVYFAGETSKTEDITTPAGLMTISSDIDTFEINNCIGSYWFSNLTFSGEGSYVSIDRCKFYDSFSQMVYSKNLQQIDITNSEMKSAGGPIVIMIETGDINTQLNIDSTSNMESWVTGSEVWFTINMQGAATVVPMLISMAVLPDQAGAGTHYATLKKVTDDKGEETLLPAANLIAVLIPDPGDVMTNQKSITGTINVGDNTYGMEDEGFNALISLNAISATGASLAQNTLDVLSQGGSNAEQEAQLGLLKAGFESLAAIPYAPVYKSGSTYAFVGGSVDDPEFNTLSQLQTLYYGCLSVKQALLDAADQYRSVQPETAAVLEALAAQWDSLAQTADLVTVATAASANDWTAGQLAFWVNPAVMGQQGNKHFMILLGENQAVAD